MKKITLFMQNNPGNSSSPKNSHRLKSKRKWCKTFFKVAFRLLEVLSMVLQIIHYICEMFKK